MLSEKQLEILKFPFSGYDALICDGAIRSGKTIWMAFSYIRWAMDCFDGQGFVIGGKSVGSVERNIIKPLQRIKYLQEQFDIKYKKSEHCLTVSRGSKHNDFYVFGGKDESSQDLVQGFTSAGVFLDEVALMPQSFVNQATARCSVPGRKLWFNCNPENPLHWFRQEWLLQLDQKKAMHLHFTLDDNPGLTEEIKEGYRNMYTGVFYQRFILGLWVIAEGVIYDMFDTNAHVYRPSEKPVDLEWTGQRIISVDYGTTNPTRFLDTYDYDGRIYVDREYSWDSKKQHRQKTDEEYAEDLLKFMGDKPCPVVVDPSAASFIVALERKGVYVVKADNTVLDGIRKVAVLLYKHWLTISSTCTDLIDEFGTYSWDPKAAQRGEEEPIKANDHSMDALRYRVNLLPAWWFE